MDENEKLTSALAIYLNCFGNPWGVVSEHLCRYLGPMEDEELEYLISICAAFEKQLFIIGREVLDGKIDKDAACVCLAHDYPKLSLQNLNRAVSQGIYAASK